MLTTFIYTLSEPDGTVRYVGKSDNPKRRLTKHLHEARTRRKNRRDKWIYSLLNKGLRPVMTVIEVVSTEAWVEREKYWINHYLNLGCKLVNGSSGGEGGDCFRNRKHSEATKEKGSILESSCCRGQA